MQWQSEPRKAEAGQLSSTIGWIYQASRGNILYGYSSTKIYTFAAKKAITSLRSKFFNSFISGSKLGFWYHFISLHSGRTRTQVGITPHSHAHQSHFLILIQSTWRQHTRLLSHRFIQRFVFLYIDIITASLIAMVLNLRFSISRAAFGSYGQLVVDLTLSSCPFT